MIHKNLSHRPPLAYRLVNLLTMKCLGSRSRLARDLKWRWLGWVVQSRLMRNTAWWRCRLRCRWRHMRFKWRFRWKRWSTWLWSAPVCPRRWAAIVSPAFPWS